jgi:hypothetical protein
MAVTGFVGQSTPAGKRSAMGRQSREHPENRKRLKGSCDSDNADPERMNRIAELEQELNSLAGGDAVFWASPDCPPDVRESNLEDILV